MASARPMAPYPFASGQTYNPDFIVETEKGKFIVEVKDADLVPAIPRMLKKKPMPQLNGRSKRRN